MVDVGECVICICSRVQSVSFPNPVSFCTCGIPTLKDWSNRASRQENRPPRELQIYSTSNKKVQRLLATYSICTFAAIHVELESEKKNKKNARFAQKYAR